LKTDKWLIHIVNIALRERAAEHVQEADAIAFIEEQSRSNGFDDGLEPDVLGLQLVEELGIEAREFQVVNEVMHGAYLTSHLLSGPLPQATGFEILACLAYSLGELDTGNRLLEHRRRVVEGETPEAADALIRRLGHFCLAANCDLSNRLTTHPILILRSRNTYVAMGRIAILIEESRHSTQSTLETEPISRILGDGENRLRRAVSANAALASADGIIDAMERRLLDSMIRLARFTEAEAGILRSELESPHPIDDLLDPEASLAERKCIYRLLYLGAYINGEHHHSEFEFIHALGTAFGDDSSILASCESIALANFEANFSHTDILMPPGVLSLVRERLTRRFDVALRRTGTNLRKEVAETKELMALVVKSSGQTLTQDEGRRVREQLMDLLRGIPALAIFAVPGGAFLLPLVIKFLGIELRPSSFIDSVKLGEAQGETEPNADEDGP